MRGQHPLRNWRAPLLTVLGMSATVGAIALVDPQPGPLVLGGVLAMTLSRNRLVTTWRGRVEAVVLLPFVGFATAGVGYLLFSLPILGAAIYVIAMFLSIWLRRFGAVWSRVGSLIALPFITLLIAPGAGVGTPLWGAAVLSLVALAIVVALRLLAEATRFVSRERPEPRDLVSTPRPSSLRPIASTRMALQLAIALIAAFVIGAVVFPQHLTWVVLTAFLVCSGNRGRADVVYKSGLRILGAAAGSIVASGLLLLRNPGHPFLQGPPLVIVLLGILGIALWLRNWTYAAWALAVTLVITLLQGVAIPITPDGGAVQLWTRVLAIVVGAICGLAASWFVLPVRSEPVVRRRLADTLAVLSEYIADRSPENDARLDGTLSKLDEVAPAWDAWERLSGWRKTTRKPGLWMHLLHECVSLIRTTPQLSVAARRALGNARKSMRDPVAIGPALSELHAELAKRA